MTREEAAKQIAKDIRFGQSAEESIEDIAMRITFTLDRLGMLPPLTKLQELEGEVLGFKNIVRASELKWEDE